MRVLPLQSHPGHSASDIYLSCNNNRFVVFIHGSRYTVDIKKLPVNPRRISLKRGGTVRLLRKGTA